MQWSDNETRTAQEMKKAGKTYIEIAEYLNRTLWGVRAHLKRDVFNARRRTRYHAERRRTLGTVGKRGEISVQDAPDPLMLRRLLDQRDARMARGWRDLTGLLLGDPRIGCSALD